MGAQEPLRAFLQGRGCVTNAFSSRIREREEAVARQAAEDRGLFRMCACDGLRATIEGKRHHSINPKGKTLRT